VYLFNISNLVHLQVELLAADAWPKRVGDGSVIFHSRF
jgi:hypothetical protein